MYRDNSVDHPKHEGVKCLASKIVASELDGPRTRPSLVPQVSSSRLANELGHGLNWPPTPSVIV